MAMPFLLLPWTDTQLTGGGWDPLVCANRQMWSWQVAGEHDLQLGGGESQRARRAQTPPREQRRADEPHALLLLQPVHTLETLKDGESERVASPLS